MKAAQQGLSEAQRTVGLFYEKGIAVTKDEKKAFEWMLKAAKQGNASAQDAIGSFYVNGCGVRQNYDQAIYWFNEAMKQNYAYSYNNMAYLYIQGKGIQEDKKKAFELLEKAIELDPYNLAFYESKGVFYAMTGNKESALEMWNFIVNKDPNIESKNSRLLQYIRMMQAADVDTNIPIANYKNESTFAIVIANENYLRESKVPYALNDGQVLAKYCQQTLGLPESNIRLVKDATLNDIKYHINWLRQVIDVYGKDTKVIFYYAGHGIPDEAQQTAYLLPVDGYGSDVSTGYSLQELYNTLGEMPSQSIMVFLDACFSGAKRDGGMLASARGIAIKVKPNKPSGNMIVFSASQGDETAYPFEEQQHGMFTYFLLKKLQETKGEVSIGDLSQYVTDQVRKRTILNGKLQSPIITPSPMINTDWEEWKLK